MLVGRQDVLERAILRIADREKQHFACDLHDGLCQSLAGVAALTSALSRSLAADGQIRPSAVADDIARLLNETIRESMTLDVSGHYSRPDVFTFEVKRERKG